MPSKVWVMRHAEKLPDPDDPNLSPDGLKRAQRLVAWVPKALGKPDFIFATAASKHSERPIQTVTPLAKSLGIEIRSKYADQDYGSLAQAILTRQKFMGKTVLVCWHHGNIPGLMRYLNAGDGTYPDPWSHLVFNLVLVADYTVGTVPNVTPITEPF